MSSRYLNKNRKAKKGISPVIATVILVAVAVVIAAALAGFSSSLFGSYSQGSQITIRSVSMDVLGDGELDIVNKGSSSETVTKVAATIGATTYDALDSDDTITDDTGLLEPIVLANDEAIILFDMAVAVDELVEGQQVTLTVTTASGQQYTISTVVTA